MSAGPAPSKTGLAGSYRPRCALVTGAAGAIGQHLTTALCDLGVETVVALDDLSVGYRSSLPDRPSLRFVQGDVTDDRILDEAFDQAPDIVFHLAALFANEKSIEMPCLDLTTNGLGTLKILLRSLDCQARVVYPSTSCALDGAEGESLDEGREAVRYETPYQITKSVGEKYCLYFTHRYGLETVRLRIFNSYGPGEIPGRHRNAIANFFYLAMQGSALPILGTGDETRDWTFVADVVQGLLLAGASRGAAGNTVHLGTGRETAVIDVAHEINRLTGNPGGIMKMDRRPWDHQLRRRAGLDHTRSLLGYTSPTSIVDGLRTTADWFRANWSRIEALARF